MEQRLQPVQPTTAHVVTAEARLTLTMLSFCSRPCRLSMAGSHGLGGWHGCPYRPVAPTACCTGYQQAHQCSALRAGGLIVDGAV